MLFSRVTRQVYIRLVHQKQIKRKLLKIKNRSLIKVSEKLKRVPENKVKYCN